MMGVRSEAVKSARRRKRAAKKRKRELSFNSLNSHSQSSLNDMEEIHLKRRVLDPSSELLLTWWDETKNQQEGLLISCKCNNNCPSSTASSSVTNASGGTTAASNNNDTDGKILLREKLNIRSPPYVSNMMDTSYSGVALYNEANGISQSDLTTSTPSVSSSTRLVNIRPKASSMNRVTVGVGDIAMGRHDANWRSKRPYPCDYCAKPFRTSYEKRRHEMIHTGDRPWKCTECNKSFVDRACLRNHMKKRHVGDKPYKCSFCDITFFGTMNRAKHEQTHEERLKAAKVEMALKREMASSMKQDMDTSVALVQVSDQLRQQLIDTSEELEVGNGVEGEDPMLIKQEQNQQELNDQAMNNESNHAASDDQGQDADMADVFNITVIPDAVTIVEADTDKPS